MAARVRSESAQRISGCVTALLREQPFFGSLALRLPVRPDGARETLASDGREIRYSPQWIAETDAHIIETAIARVVLACALKHHTRRSGRDPERWQRASQLVTHGLLRDAGFTLPPGAEAWDGISVEQAYDRLPEPEPDAPGNDGSPPAGGSGGSGDSAAPSGPHASDHAASAPDTLDDGGGGNGDPSGGRDEPEGGSPDRGSSGAPPSCDPSGTGEVMDAPSGDGNDDASGPPPGAMAAEEQDWDEAVHQALSLAKAQPVSAIAARFGASERIVEQRLRLGNAAPELLDAYRRDEIDLEVLKAFAVTADRERQMAVWEQVSGQDHRPSAWQVKRLLTEERVPGTSAIARFIGVESYEAAGGRVLRDLFADEHDHGVWFEDPVLLEKLATDKLRAAADELAARWKWAVPMVEVAWDDTASYGRIEPQPGTPTDEERAEIEKLETRYGEINGLGEDEWTDDVVREAETIEARLDEIEGAVEGRAMWRREDFLMAGCIATIGRDGALHVIAGLVKPEDMPKPDGTGDAATGDADGHGPDAGDGVHGAGPAVSQPVAEPRDRAAEARREAGVGIGLADDLRAIRTALVKAHLAGDFEAAFDLALFQMGRAVFATGYHSEALDIVVRETPDRPMTRMNDAEFTGWSPGEAMLEHRSHLSFDWMEIEDDGESFAALKALPRAEKEALFAACVARTVKGQLAFEPQARPELEATVARLDIDFAAHVRPTAGMLWSRINKARVLDIARTVFGLAWASARSKYKKPALADAMEAAFAAGDPPTGVSAAMHARALAWVPPGFAAFDTGRAVEDGDAGDVAAEAAGTDPDGPAETPEAEEPAADSGTATAEAAPAGNGHGTEADPESEPSDGAAAKDGKVAAGTAGPGSDADPRDTGEIDSRPAVAGGPDGTGTAGPVDGRDVDPDRSEIPEFLQRVQ